MTVKLVAQLIAQLLYKYMQGTILSGISLIASDQRVRNNNCTKFWKLILHAMEICFEIVLLICAHTAIF